MLAMPEPEAISYSRYSNLRQASGESEARQAEENEAIAASLGLPLNQNLVPLHRGFDGFGWA